MKGFSSTRYEFFLKMLSQAFYSSSLRSTFVKKIKPLFGEVCFATPLCVFPQSTFAKVVLALTLILTLIYLPYSHSIHSCVSFLFLVIQMPLKMPYFKPLENIDSIDTTVNPTEINVRELFLKCS
jgi:formate/nitrite transporter FocA (FNT family)